MTDDLFPNCKQDSPRLAWMKKHGVCVCQTFKGFYTTIPCAMPSNRTQFYPTADEALAAWAESCGIKLWNEEDYKKEHK